MRLHRFYISSPIRSDVFDVADRDLVHQWKKVFRYNVGSQVIVFDGSGFEYLCLITSLRALGATLTLAKKSHALTTVRRNVWLCMSLIKNDNFDMVVQKATEIGVSAVVPLLVEHSEKKKVKDDRLKKIAVEATEQSGWGRVPYVERVSTLAEIFDRGILPQEKIALQANAKNTLELKKYLDNTNPQAVAVFVGPEGGWSDKELLLFKSFNVPLVTLGASTLRAETAAIAVSSLLLL